MTNERKQILLMVAIYGLAHGPILLLSNALFWDDWAYYNAPAKYIIKDFEFAGAFFNYAAWIHIAMMSAGIWLYKILSFLLILGSGVLLYYISMRDFRLNESLSFWASLIYLASPLYIARVANIDFIYTLSVFLFMLAWWVYYKNIALALMLFFISFNTQSLLVFYAIPFASIYVNSDLRGRPLAFARKNITLISLPFIWYGIKQMYFKPEGPYEDYLHGINLANIIPAAKMQWHDLKYYLISDLFDFSNTLHLIPFLVAICAIQLLVRRDSDNVNLHQIIKATSIGVIFLILGLVPYWILGYVPTSWEWTSRHQLLMPFGMCFLIVGLLSILRNQEKHALLVVILSLFVTMNARNYLDLYNDWSKQIKIINFLKQSPLVKEAQLVVFDDATNNALRRKYRFYEWSGMISYAIPGEWKRFGISTGEYSDYKKGSMDEHFDRFYSSHLHQRKEGAAAVKISIKYLGNSFEIKEESLIN